jgi:hypothetical protein
MEPWEEKTKTREKKKRQPPTKYAFLVCMINTWIRPVTSTVTLRLPFKFSLALVKNISGYIRQAIH